MAAWAGFSDEDLRKLKRNTSHDGPTRAKNAAITTQSGPGNRSNPNRDRQSALKHQADRPVTKVNQAMMLQPSIPPVSASQGSSHRKPRIPDSADASLLDASESPVSSSSSSQEPQTLMKVEPNDPSELDDKEAMSRDMMSLEKFREQQKAIEEANKQKKALLSKTLSERRKKAKAEAHKLEHIQKELAKLDHLLTADVQVIRNRIEDVSRDFLEAQKRYERAEKEFIEAKVDLHDKSELKEQMTEHLYTIIHQNEVRKARKLAELMKELEMDGADEEFQLPDLPPLSSFQPTSPCLLSPTKIHQPVTEKSLSENPSKTSATASVDGSGEGICVQEPSSDKTSQAVPDKYNEPAVVDQKTDLVLSSEDNMQQQTDNSFSVISENNHSNHSTNAIQEQTSKIMGDLEAHVQKELETVQKLMAENSAEDLKPAPSEPNSWNFNENTIIKQET